MMGGGTRLANRPQETASLYGSSGSPVFVVGSSRSGTTLLYSILLASGDFAVYEAETWLLESYAVRCGNLTKAENRKAFIAAWIESEQFKRSGLSAEPFAAQLAQATSYAGVLKLFMENIASLQGKHNWVEKTPGHVFHMEELARGFSDAKFIHLIRDGRDVASSKRKLGWSGTNDNDPMKQLIWAAKGWEYAVNRGRSAGAKPGTRYLELRYENLLTNMDEALNKINLFLHTDITIAQVQQCRVGALGKNNSAFANDGAVISRNALQRWKSDLSLVEIAAINLAIGKALSTLGYEAPTRSTALDLTTRLKVAWWSLIAPRVFALRRFLKHKTALGRWYAKRMHLGLG